MAKVRLKRLAIEEGNSYHAGVYEANYLPPSILNDPDLIENLEGKITTPNFNNALKTEEITIGTDKPNSQEITFKGEPAKIIDSGSQEKNPPTQADEATPLNINKATVDDLAAIDRGPDDRACRLGAFGQGFGSWYGLGVSGRRAG